MSRLFIPSRDEAPGKSKPMLDSVDKQLGVPRPPMNLPVRRRQRSVLDSSSSLTVHRVLERPQNSEASLHTCPNWRKSMMKALSALAFTGVLVAFGAGAATAQSLTDPQIAHAAYTADELDIAYAKIALEKTKNAEVRQFAELMIKDHTAANEAALALVKKLGVTPQDNPFSQTLGKNGEAKKAELRGLSGAAFDRAYAQNELAYHDVVVKTVAEQWIPGIQNAEFKKFMTDANEIFKVHLAHARGMVDSLK